MVKRVKLIFKRTLVQNWLLYMLYFCWRAWDMAFNGGMAFIF